MLEQLHQHMVAELEHSNRTDNILVVVAVAFNLFALPINLSFAKSYSRNSGDDMLFVFLILITALVNLTAIVTLLLGRRTQEKVRNGLLALYADHQIDKYYNKSLVVNYTQRYLLLIGVILTMGIAAIFLPLVVSLFFS